MQGACFKTNVVQGAYGVASEQQYARRVLQDYCSAGSIQGSMRAAVCRVQGARCRRCRVLNAECKVQNARLRVQGVECRGAKYRVHGADCSM